jgi:hypothetical protein
MPAFASKLFSVFALARVQLRALFQVAEADPPDYPFAASDVAQLHLITADPACASIDGQTWNELLVAPYLSTLSAQVSIFGQQVLHQRLCAGLGDEASAALGERLRTLMDDPARLGELRAACRSLRRADCDIAALLFGAADPDAPSWAGRSWALPLALIASVAGAAVSPLAWLGAGAALYLLISIQMRYHERVEEWQRLMGSLQMLLRTCSLLGARDDPLLRRFGALRARAGQINRSLNRAPLPGLIPGLREYADWFLLANVSHYFKCLGLVREHRDFLRQCYTECANFEADLALARHLLDTPSACWAERRGDGGIALEQAVHPLLERATPLDFALAGKGAFISGQNGIGKSTLLRTVGLNLIVARAFGFCYARRARVAALPVYASMQGEDSLLGGESLYMAQLRRAGELLAAADGAHRGIFIIDEIFRGTNHLESVSAAAAVLDALAAKGMVIVSSHNLVLAPLLAHRLAPFCVSAPGGDTSRLTLSPGVLAHTNGIDLLAARGFGSQVESNAMRVFDWLGSYLAHPAHCENVLTPSAACDPHEHKQGQSNLSP